MPSIKQVGLHLALYATLFGAGMAVGSLRTTSVAAQNKFGQPKTVLHVVVYKFKDATSENDRQKALDGIKDLARKIPGVKNVWLKTNRNQIRDFSGVYAIEFTSPENFRAFKLLSKKQFQFPLDRWRTIPYLRRIIESIALSGSKRLAHF